MLLGLIKTTSTGSILGTGGQADLPARTQAILNSKAHKTKIDKNVCMMFSSMICLKMNILM